MDDKNDENFRKLVDIAAEAMRRATEPLSRFLARGPRVIVVDNTERWCRSCNLFLCLHCYLNEGHDECAAGA